MSLCRAGRPFAACRRAEAETWSNIYGQKTSRAHPQTPTATAAALNERAHPHAPAPNARQHVGSTFFAFCILFITLDINIITIIIIIIIHLVFIAYSYFKYIKQIIQNIIIILLLCFWHGFIAVAVLDETRPIPTSSQLRAPPTDLDITLSRVVHYSSSSSYMFWCIQWRLTATYGEDRFSCCRARGSFEHCTALRPRRHPFQHNIFEP